MSEHAEHVHEDGTEHTHEEPPGSLVEFAQQFRPQPVPMGWTSDLEPMADGTDRVRLTLMSVNGAWTGYFDRDGAIVLGKKMIELAFMPPVMAEEPSED